MQALAYMLYQDDPKKCTAAKLVKLGLIKVTRKFSSRMIILNPFSKQVINKSDSILSDSLCVIDCSWNKADNTLLNNRYLFSEMSRRIPLLLAGNPVNYSKLGKLSSVEALSSSYYILGQNELARLLLSKFKWGHTFLDLNSEVLKDYSNAENSNEIEQIENEYFGSYTKI